MDYKCFKNKIFIYTQWYSLLIDIVYYIFYQAQFDGLNIDRNVGTFSIISTLLLLYFGD